MIYKIMIRIGRLALEKLYNTYVINENHKPNWPLPLKHLVHSHL